MAITLTQSIIFELGDTFWIECLSGKDTSLADATTINHLFNLKKAGTLVGASMVQGATNSMSGVKNVILTDTSNAVLDALPQTNLTKVRVRTRQESGGPVAIWFSCLLFMRLPAR